MEIRHEFDPTNDAKPLPQLINFHDLELEGLKKFAKRITEAMKSVQNLSNIESFESDLKMFISIFDQSHPKDALRRGNWILKDFITQVRLNYPIYNKNVIRYIGKKLIHERIKHMNRLEREKIFKKKQAKKSKKSEKSEKSVQSKFDSMSLRSKRKVKEFSK